MIMNIHFNDIRNLLANNKIVKNSFLGVFNNVVQNIFFSIFFIIIARHYSQIDFGNYVISNTMYSFILGFSTLGLGNWFVREISSQNDRVEFINLFLKVQFLLAILFYFMNLFIVYLIYDNTEIRLLSFLIGLNLLPDNIIYVVKNIGIAEIRQEKIYLISSLESFLKFLLSCLLLLIPVSIVKLTLLLIVLRLATLFVFLYYGTENKISLNNIWNIKPEIRKLFNIISSNWAFVVIASIAIVNWRIGNIFISKYLTIRDVGYFEIAFKLLSLAYIIPVVVSSTIFPQLVESANENKLMKKYQVVFHLYWLYGLFTFTFIYSFADFIVPRLFGNQFAEVSQYCKQMFIVMLLFPTVLLQANLMIAIKKEKIDMYCNIVGLCVNVMICLFFLNSVKSITVVILAIIASFLVFHVIQDVVLVKTKRINVLQIIRFYSLQIIGCGIFFWLSSKLNPTSAFVLFWLTIILLITIVFKYKKISNLLPENSIKLFIENK